MFFKLVLLLVALFLLWDFLQILKTQRLLKVIPLTSKIPVFGSIMKMSSFRPENLHLKFREYIELFGKTFAGRAFGSLIIVTADQRYIEDIISSPIHTRKYVLYNLLRSWLGNGLLLSSGPNWQNMRKIITPTFHFKILETFVEVFDKQSRILIEKLSQLSDGVTVIDIYPFMGLTTLDIIAGTAMGVKINAQNNAESEFVKAVNRVTEIFATRFMNPHLALPFVFKNFTPKMFARQYEGIEIMHRFTDDIILQRRLALEAERNIKSVVEKKEEDFGLKPKMALLDVLLQATIDGQPLPAAQIRDEVNTFMFEGHDTTTTATSFCLYLISRHSKCQQKLFEEIRAQFGNDPKQAISYQDLLNMEYLTCVIKESLRLYPPIPAIGRWLKEEIKLVDTTLPAGTNVIILIWELLRDAEFFPEPLVFQPERHLDGHSGVKPYVYIPFSAGPRNCIGQRFALFEMKTIIVNILRHYELLAAGEDVQPSIKIVLKSKTGVNFSIRPRIY